MSDREKFGLDAEIAAKMDGKYSVEREKEAIAWMEAVTGLTVEPDFIGGLKNGVILCTLMNIISPGAISKFAAKPKHYLEHKVLRLISLSTLLIHSRISITLLEAATKLVSLPPI